MLAVNFSATVAGQRCGCRNHQGGRSRNTRTRWSLGGGLDQNAASRGKEANKVRSQGMKKFFRLTEFIEISETLLLTSVNGFQMNLATGQSRYAAARQNVDREVYGDGSRMEQIKRPNVQSAAREIYPARSMGHDRRKPRRR